MSMRRLLNLKGIHPWYLASAIALNLFWTILVAVVVSMAFLKKIETGAGTVQLILLVTTFIGPFLIGWIIGKMAGDHRGPTYGVYGSLGSIVVLVFAALPTAGLLGVMLIFAAIAGGLNGGLSSLQGRNRD